MELTKIELGGRDLCRIVGVTTQTGYAENGILNMQRWNWRKKRCSEVSFASAGLSAAGFDSRFLWEKPAMHATLIPMGT
jgi:hypothetical protein